MNINQSENVPILLPHNRRQSYFVTSYRNAVLYAVSSAIIYPAYLLFMTVIISFLADSASALAGESLKTGVHSGVTVILWGVVLTSLLLEIVTPRWWRNGFAERELNVLVSGLLLLVIAWHYGDTDWIVTLKLAAPWFVLGVWRLVDNWRLRGAALATAIMSAGFMVLVSQFIGDTWLFYLLNISLIQSLVIFVALLALASLTLFTLWYAGSYLRWQYKTIPKEKNELYAHIVSFIQAFIPTGIAAFVAYLTWQNVLFDMLNLPLNQIIFIEWIAIISLFAIGLVIFRAVLWLGFWKRMMAVLITYLILSNGLFGLLNLSPEPLTFIDLIALVSFVSIGVFMIYAALRIGHWWQRVSRDATRHLQGRRRVQHVLVTAISLGATVFFLITGAEAAEGVSPLAAAFGLLTLLLADKPGQYLSRQRANLRWLFATLRHDILHDRHSPFIAPSRIINQLSRRSLPRFFRLNNRSLYSILMLLLGGIGVPVLYYWLDWRERQSVLRLFNGESPPYNPELAQWLPELPSSLELMIVGVVSAFVLLLIYILFWVFSNRSRYIVSEFDISAAPEKEAEIKAIAKLTTHLVVEELQKISILLRLRQVENVNLSFDDNNVFFVTSGIDQDFVNQLQQVVTVDVPHTPFMARPVNLGQMAAVFFRLLARIRVQGKIQQRTNGTLEIWAQIVYHNNRAAAVEQVVQPENSVTEIDNVLMRPIARELALKLFIELGQVTHLGSNFQSLDHLLIGLSASAERNWWRAIAFYRQALQIEEAYQRQFGVVHYHLGAALIFQGDWEHGIEHLYTADLDGPLMAETQYMLALALVYRYWGDLHRSPNIFNEIKERLALAAQLRPAFPEAYQLWGTAYYRRGRLQERYLTRVYTNVSDSRTRRDDTDATRHQLLMKNYLYYYQQASRLFRRAIALYDAGYARSDNFDNYSGSQPYDPAVNRQRVTVAHQLGDALRSLRRYQESDSYYRDVIAVDPRNLRNLVDLSKTYCLQKNWQRAENFIWQSVFNHDIGYWDADACLHMGWALAGGIQDAQTSWYKRWLDDRLKSLYGHRIEDHARRPAQQIAQAFQYLDYAIHQRPRYITAWRQTNWLTPFHGAILNIATDKNVKWQRPDEDTVYALDEITPSDYLFMPLAQYEHDGLQQDIPGRRARQENDLVRLKQMRVWLAFRMDSYGFWDEDAPPDTDSAHTAHRLTFLNNDLHHPDNWQAEWGRLLTYLKASSHPVAGHHVGFRQLVRFYEQLKQSRQQVGLFLEMSQRLRRTSGLFLQYERLRLAEDLYSTWRELACEPLRILTWDGLLENFDSVNAYYKERSQQPVKSGLYPTFVDRLLLEIYAEFTLLTARMLAECEWFERLHEVASHGIDTLHDWLKWWRTMYDLEHISISAGYTEQDAFSPRVTRYQQASLYAWRAYARFFRRDHNASRLSAKARQTPPAWLNQRQSVWLNEIEKDLEEARTNIRNHPLILYMQAKVYTKQNLQQQAIEEFERLIDLISPYDPKQTIGNTRMTDYISREPYGRWKPRKRMYVMERVCGRQQFYNMIDLPRVHMEIANTYRQLDQPELRVSHLFEALRWSSFYDLDLENFLRMANQLNSIERYDEAIAIIDALARPAQQLGLRYLARSRQQTAYFLRCIVDTRAGRFGDSMARARQLAANFTLTVDPLQAVQIDLLDEIYTSTTAEAADNPATRAPVGYKEQFEALYLIADALLQTHTLTKQAKEACNRAARQMQIQPDETKTTPGQAQEEPGFKTLLEGSIQQAREDYRAAHPHQRNEYRTDSTPEEDDANQLPRQLRIFSRLHETSPVSDREQRLRHVLVNEELLNNPAELSADINNMTLHSASDEHSQPRGDDSTLTEDEKHNRRLDNLAKAARMTVPLLCEADFVALIERIHYLDEANLRHLMRIAAGHHTDWLAPGKHLPLSLPYARLLLIDMVQFISREYSNRLSQIAELTNVLAYNRAETGLHLAHAYEDSAFATALTSYMMNLTPSGTSVREQFARKLAQFADTLAWVRYRDVTHYHSDWRDSGHHDVDETAPEPRSTLFDAPKLPHATRNLKIAERYLRYSVRYDQQRAIVHYHLARVYLTRAELEWQSDPDIVGYLETRAPYIDAAITQAFRHWRQANEFDRFDRLHIKLNWLYGQISEYKHAWEKRQFRGVAGDENAEFMSSFFSRPAE